MKAAWIALVVASLLVGCAKEVDQSQIEVEDGVLYLIGEDKPFTGEVSNLPASMLPGTEIKRLANDWFNRNLNTLIANPDGNDAMVRKVATGDESVTCVAPIRKGYIDGEFSCGIGRNKDLAVGEYDEGNLVGDFAIYTKDKSYKLIEAAFSGGKMNGKTIYRSNLKNQVTSEYEYVDGVVKEHVTYNPNGTISSRETAGGDSEDYDQNGTLVSRRDAKGTLSAYSKEGKLTQRVVIGEGTFDYDEKGTIVHQQTSDGKNLFLSDVTGKFIDTSMSDGHPIGLAPTYAISGGKSLDAYRTPGVPALSAQPSSRYSSDKQITVLGCTEGWCEILGYEWVREKDLQAVAVRIGGSSLQHTYVPNDDSRSGELVGNIDVSDAIGDESMKPYYKDMYLTSKKKCAAQNYTDECVPMEPDEYATNFELMIDENIPWTTEEILQLSRDGITKFYGNVDVHKNDTARIKLRQELCGKYRQQLEKTDDMQVCLSGGYGE